MNYIVLFDFDNTLFDTEFFKEQMYQLAMVHGYSVDDAKEIYKEARTSGNQISLTLEHYLNVLKDQLHGDKKTYNRESVIPILATIAAHDGKLPGAKELLELVSELGFEKKLLSLGIPEWQEKKIEQAQLGDYFSDEEIIFTTDEQIGKIDYVKKFAESRNGGQGIIMFNDKPTEMREVLEQFPNVVVFGRYEVRDSRYTEEEFEKLEEDFPARFMWSDNLFELKDRFEEFYG